MKNILLIFASAFLIIFSASYNKAYATHSAGGELIYVHISDSTYQFFMKFYRDCTGSGEPPSFTLCFYNTCTNQNFSVNMPKWTGTLPPDNRRNGSPVSSGCGTFSTKCDNINNFVPGYEEWWYSCIATLPLKCNYWRFGVSLCCRNTSNNLQGQDNFYVETTFNSSFTWDNSSPYYSVKPIPYVCLNQPYSYNNGALDSDGDSLWSAMMNPLNNTSCAANNTLVPLQPGLTPPINFTNNPLQTNGSFNLNGGNGQMSFTATQTGASALSMRTKEYRKNKNNVMTEIGSIMRDVQVQVLACNIVPPTLNIISGNLQGNTVYGCVGQNVNFCFNVASSNPDAVLLAEDNLNLTIPGATMTYTNLRTDTVTGCFSWTPVLKDVGAHSFILLIKDSTCDPPGIMLQYAKTIDLYIWGPVTASPDTSICIGEPAFLGVNGGGNYKWTILSGTNPSLSNPNIPNPVATPKVKTTYLVTSTVNPYCTVLNKDTVVIDVLKGPDMAGQPDDTTCPNVPLKMGLGITKDPNATYTIQWSPAAGLDNSTIENPTATLKTSKQYTVTVNSSLNRCKSLDTVNVDVLTGFSIDNNDTAICNGKTVDITGTGDTRYTYTWIALTDQAATFTPPNDIQTTITPGDTGKHVYTITARFPKCLDAQGQPIDSTARIEIDIQPIPTAKVSEDESLCYGDTMQLSAIVQPDTYHDYTYTWTPGAALDFPDHKDPIFSAITEGVTTLTFVVSTPAGCSATDLVDLNVFAAKFIDMPADTAICSGDTVAVSMTITDGSKFYWLPDYNISSVSSVQPRVWPVADQLYTVYGVDKFGCMDTGNIKVTVHARAVIDMPDSIIIYPGESYQMDPGGNCLYYTWFPPLGLNSADISNPAVSPKVNTRYTVHGRTEAGCIATETVDVLVKNDSYLNLPNAFTPGKRTNGTLKIVRRGMADLKSFAVYNRWGTKVFETSDINEGWDGTYKGETQPLGVYIYTIEAKTPSGQTINKQGNVTLLR